jgi:hypothetical protein
MSCRLGYLGFDSALGVPLDYTVLAGGVVYPGFTSQGWVRRALPY